MDVQLGGSNPSPCTSIRIVTDGSCVTNPGTGGWACIIQYPDGKEIVLTGQEPDTTNNRMEVTSAIKGLESLPPGQTVEVITDSEYLRRGASEWLPQWKQRGWVTKVRHNKSSPILNQDLWKEIDRLISTHSIIWTWVKGHAKHGDNIRCDELAGQAAKGTDKT